MSASDKKNDHWTTYWTNNQRLQAENLNSQIGRTVHGIPIEQQKWQFHLDEIERILDLGPSDTLLDLCAGNGLISVPFSLKCRSVTAVDISSALLERIDASLYPNITIIAGDARTLSLPPKSFSKGIMYFALQYFNECEAIGVFETIYQSLMPGGMFLVGDIPDIDRLFVFYNKPEWVKAYFDSIKANAPAIGTWFKMEVLVEMAKYVGFSDAKACNQHPDMINSHYRFDLLLKK